MSSNRGASCTISLVIPVSAKMGKGISFCGFTSVSHLSTISAPLCIIMAISVMRLPEALPPVVSISTMANSFSFIYSNLIFVFCNIFNIIQFVEFKPRQPYFMLLRVRFPMSHAYIFLNLPMYIKLPLLVVRIPRIGDERHLCHFGNGNSRKMIINLYVSQKQVAAATLKRVFFQAVCKMCRIKIISFHIDPGSEIHRPPFGRY